MQKDSEPFAKLKVLQSQRSKPTAQVEAHLILTGPPKRTHHPNGK